MEGIKRTILHKQITDKELTALPGSTKVYQGVGRCFIASTIPDIRQGIGKSIAELEEKVTKLEVRSRLRNKMQFGGIN